MSGSLQEEVQPCLLFYMVFIAPRASLQIKTSPGLENLINFATNDKMNTNNEIMGSPRERHNILYILNTVLKK